MAHERDPACLRPLRFLHRDLPHLPAAGRRARLAPRTHLPDQGDAGERPARRCAYREASRPLPLLPVLHGDLPFGCALHAPDRPCAGPYRGDLSAPAARPAAPLAADAGAALSRTLPAGAGGGKACPALSTRSSAAPP